MKEQRLEIRASESDMLAWCGAAAMAGLSLSAWARLALNTSAAVEDEMTAQDAAGCVPLAETKNPGPLTHRYKPEKVAPALCERCQRTKSPSCPECRKAFGLA